MLIRPAHPAEAGALAALAVRSKAHWPYPAAFVARFARGLALTAEVVGANDVWVADDGGAVRGFYTLLHRGTHAILDDLWIEPAAIGCGTGRLLFQHAAVRAATAGARTLRWEAEPYAVGFYERMGGTTTGWADSRLGRRLPVMQVSLSHIAPTREFGGSVRRDTCGRGMLA